jgi:hypothetical protein
LVTYSLSAAALNSISSTNDDLPLPDTPVTHVNFPSGNLTSIFFRLLAAHPFISITFPLPFLLTLGTSIRSLPDKYFPVKL